MINVANTSKAYSEVYSFLNTLGVEYISKIPNNIYTIIEEFRDKEFHPQYSIDQKVTSDTFSKEALALIAALNLQYFCKNTEEKRELKMAYLKNTEIEREKYNTDNIFKKKQENIQAHKEETLVNEMQLIEYREVKWYKRLFNKILKLFKKY